MTDKYVTRAAFVVETAGGLSATAGEIVEAIPGKARKTGLLDQWGEPIYRRRESVAFGFRGRVKPGRGG